jgi:hypothetical protein
MKSKNFFISVVILIITIIPVMNITAQSWWWWTTTTTSIQATPAPTPPPVQTYTITAYIVGGEGYMEPTGEIIVQEGASQTFIISANGGHGHAVEVDGVDLGSIISYTFENVTADHTIVAHFWYITPTQPPTTSTTTSVYGQPWKATFDNEPGGRFTINAEKRIWYSGTIDISQEGIFSLLAEIEGDNAEVMESSDYLNLYYVIDGGNYILWSENTDGFTLHLATVHDLSGSTMVVKIEGSTDEADEFYYVDNIEIGHRGGPTTQPTPEPTTEPSTTTTSSGWWWW